MKVHWTGMGAKRGAALTEYVITGLLVGVFSIGGVSVFSDDIRALFSASGNSLAGVDSTPATRTGKAESYSLKGVVNPEDGVWDEGKKNAIRQALENLQARQEPKPLGSRVDQMPGTKGWKTVKVRNDPMMGLPGMRVPYVEPRMPDALRAFLSPITGIPDEYVSQNRAARQTMSSGWDRLWQGQAMGGLEMTLGTAAYLFSPLTALTRSVAGRPVENAALATGAPPWLASGAGMTAEVGMAWMTGEVLKKAANAIATQIAARYHPVVVAKPYTREIWRSEIRSEIHRQVRAGGGQGRVEVRNPATGEVAQVEVTVTGSEGNRVIAKTSFDYTRATNVDHTLPDYLQGNKMLSRIDEGLIGPNGKVTWLQRTIQNDYGPRSKLVIDQHSGIASFTLEDPHSFAIANKHGPITRSVVPGSLIQKPLAVGETAVIKARSVWPPYELDVQVRALSGGRTQFTGPSDRALVVRVTDIRGKTTSFQTLYRGDPLEVPVADPLNSNISIGVTGHWGSIGGTATEDALSWTAHTGNLVEKVAKDGTRVFSAGTAGKAPISELLRDAHGAPSAYQDALLERLIQ